MFNSRTHKANCKTGASHTTTCPMIQSTGVERKGEKERVFNLHQYSRPAGTHRLLSTTRLPIGIEAICSIYNDTLSCWDTLLMTADFDCNYQPLPRHITFKPLYFKTHYRANRDPSVALIDPTNYHSLCIIGHFFGIRSCAISTRHNMFSLLLTHLTTLQGYGWGFELIDRWDSSDMIQRPLSARDLWYLLYSMFIYYHYGNKKKRSRLNLIERFSSNLIGAD